VIAEIALGSIAQRVVVLDLLANLRQFPTVQHHEILHLIARRKLWGRGLSALDVHLMAAVAMVEGAQLWTRDKRLKAASVDVGVALFDA
jgi:predicted nucleic acid-binding protein